MVTAISSAHRAICSDAIRAGKAVICEKTLAESYTLARSIKIRARDASSKQGLSQEIVVNPAAADHIVYVTHVANKDLINTGATA